MRGGLLRTMDRGGAITNRRSGVSKESSRRYRANPPGNVHTLRELRAEVS